MMYDWFALAIAVAVRLPAVKKNRGLNWPAFPWDFDGYAPKLEEGKVEWLGWDGWAQLLG